MKNTKSSKAIGLIRVSTELQAKTNDSIDGQKRSILNWAEENGVEVEKFYEEPGHSAFRGDRPLLNLILNEINEGIVTPSAVLVYSFSRFTRNALITASFKSNLLRKGIPVLSVTEPMPDDEDSAFISQTVIDMVNELQSRTNSKIVQDRLNDTAEKGYFTGGTVPFGYSSMPVTINNTHIEKKVLVINTGESGVTKEIFNLSETGIYGKALGVKDIAKYLNNKNITYRGKSWTKNKIDNILNNTIYYGERVWGKGRLTRSKNNPPITIKTPAIITQEKFNSVQRGLMERRPLTKNNVPINTMSKGLRSKTLLVGLLKCQYCGRNLRLMNGKTKGITDGIADRYQYYTCPSRTEKKCNCPNVRKDHLDQAIVDTILVHVLNDQVIAEILEEIKANIKSLIRHDEGNLLKLHKQRISLECRINKIYDMVADEVFEMDDTLKKNLSNKKSMLNNVNFCIEEINTRAKLPLRKFGQPQIAAFVEATTKFLSGEKLENSKPLLLKIIDSIIIDREKIEILGSNFKLAELISKRDLSSHYVLPTFVSIWR